MENFPAALFTAFAAGLLSFLSPCVLAALPAYAAFLTTSRETVSKMLAWRNTLVFASGFIFVFIAVGAGAAFLGQALASHHHILHKAGGVFMLLMGLHFSGLLALRRPGQHSRLLLSGRPGPWGIFLLGVLSTLAWTPCNAPLLTPVLLYAASSAALPPSILLFFTYSLGFCIPFAVLTLLLRHWLHKPHRFQPYLRFIPRLAGIFLMLAGAGILLGLFE